MEWVLKTEDVNLRSKQCSRRTTILKEDQHLTLTARQNRSINAILF